MKTRVLIAGVLIFGAITFFFVWLWPKQKPASEMVPVPVPKTGDREISVAANKVPQPRAVPGLAPNGSLARVYETAAFIDQVYGSVPPDRVATRDQLKGLQVVFFVSDYVMAAKTNRNLALTMSAISDAFTNVSPDTSILRERLRLWAERPGTLTDHYQSISENPEIKDQIKVIKEALTENDLPVDTENDLLMDCIRYAAVMTDINEMYGPNPRKLTEATPYPQAFHSLVHASDAVFEHRFTARFGLDPRTAASLMNRLSKVRLYGLSPADAEIPARLR